MFSQDLMLSTLANQCFGLLVTTSLMPPIPMGQYHRNPNSYSFHSFCTTSVLDLEVFASSWRSRLYIARGTAMSLQFLLIIYRACWHHACQSVRYQPYKKKNSVRYQRTWYEVLCPSLAAWKKLHDIRS